ncbi:hypothetical protein GGF50DRAFT_89416 [Schizophyllum commune]
MEPAIIARDVVLLTLLVDTGKESNATIWDIFYHFRISRDASDLLHKQCERLLAASEQLDRWARGPYAKFIQPRTEHTLSDIRRFWAKYSSTASFTDTQHRNMRDVVATGVESMKRRQPVSVQTACRSAGPLWMNLMKGNMADAHFKHYWNNGVVAGSPTASAEFVNPTFFYTAFGSGFSLHYGSDPILGFHLAGALAPTMGSTVATRIEDLGAYARQEFGRWADSFRKRIASGSKFVVRPYVGDALSLCRALAGEVGMTVSPYDARPIVLRRGDDAPTNNFNVIETSNLADHIGLLNTLSVCIPLVRQLPTSVLHTNSLLPSSGKIDDAFLDRVGIDLTTLSTLFGFAPLPLLTKFTTKSSPFDLLAGANMTETKQYHQHISWKLPASGDQAALESGVSAQPIAIDPASLCDVLFKLYLHMFSDENMSKQFANLSVHTIKECSLVMYVRASFAALLKLVKARVATDWRRTMEMLVSRIQDDRTLVMGMCYFQDLWTSVHLMGVYTADFLTPTFASPIPTRPVLFAEWRKTPAVAFVVMRVPRSALQRLESLDADMIGTPILQCEVATRDSGLQNVFSNIQVAFGQLRVEGSADDARATIIRDAEEWHGDAPLILSMVVPTALLELEPRSTQVRLAVRSTQQTVLVLSPILGVELVVFASQLMGNDVYVFKDAPCVAQPSPPRTSQTHTRNQSPSLVLAGGKVTHIMVRVDMLNERSKFILKEGPIEALQHTPCTMILLLGKESELEVIVPYPFPVRGQGVRLRVARKSGYAEVIVRVASADPAVMDGGYTQTKRFPVVMSRGLPCVWSLNALNLDKLPALDLSRPIPHDDWVNIAARTVTLSDREMRLIRMEDESDTFSALKNSLGHIFGYAAGIGPGRQVGRVFSLSHQSSDADGDSEGGYALIFVNAVRLDLVSHALVLDACILPLTFTVMFSILDILKVVQEKRLICHTRTNDEEVKAWKALLPASVERCRTWSHKSSCPYPKKGVPLTLETNEVPICDCGKGKSIPDSEIMKQFPVARPLVTRAAIPLLYAVPYLEDVGRDLRAAMRARGL